MPFDPASIGHPFRMQPGLRRLAAGAAQLHATTAASAHLREKLGVLQRHAEQALCVVPGWDAAPGLDTACRQALNDLPQAWRRHGDAHWEATSLGWAVVGHELQGDGPPAIGACLHALPPAWRLAGLLALAIEEDLAVLDAHTACVPWLAVCLPSHWAPQDKIGRHFAEVHAPVADNELLLKASASLARLVSGPDRWERFVWTLTPLPLLDAHPGRQPAPPWPSAAAADELIDKAWLRTERQTFIPVPGQAQAVFTIEVGMTRLSDFMQREPQAVNALAEALASMSEAVLAYRGLGSVRDRLVAGLRHRAPGHAAA